MKKVSLYGAPALVGLLTAPVCLLLVVTLAVTAWTGNSAWAAQPDRSDQPDVYIDAITFDGLGRTKRFVVRRELIVDENQIASVEDIEESVQRIRNTDLFRKVRYELVEQQGGASEGDPREGVERVVLAITLDEKWTTLPIANFSRGGGTYRLVLGAFDTNFLGRYIGIGGQYVRLGDANSFYGWLYHPRLFGQRLRGGIDVGTQNRVFRLFDGDGDLGGGFMLERFTLGSYLEKEWIWWLRTRAALRYVDDGFSFDLLSPEIESLQRARGLPDPSHALLGEMSVILGRIDQDNYLLDGSEFGLTLQHANDAIGSSYSLTKLNAGFSHFETLPWKSNLGFRVGVGTGDIDALHQRYYLGGLDAIRGFSSDRFAGEHYWLSSLEYRIPSVDTRWFVLQHIFFADAAGVSDEFGQVARLSGASTGVGLRFIVPKIHGFIARVDYAFALYGDATNPSSFGGGQFF
jgi:outer membrane protein assembly factor BamA